MSSLMYAFDMEAMRSVFSLNLITLRKNRGLSQRDISKATGISQRMIAYYETQSVVPPADKLEKLAKALGAKVSELVDPSAAESSTVELNTRTLKKVQLLEQLPAEDQRKVMDYVRDLLERNELKKQASTSMSK